MIITPGYIQAETDPIEREIAKQSLVFLVSQKLTICEQLRFIYDSVEQLPDSEIKKMIVEQLIDAIMMAKKMDARLGRYRKAEVKKTGHGGRNLRVLGLNMEREAYRTKRTI